MAHQVSKVEEPLAASAPLFEALSRTHCSADCSYYHGLWQRLRLLGLGATLGGHPECYHAAFAALFDQWQSSPAGEASRPLSTRSILIAGAADYSMLAHVLDAAGPQSRQLDITVLDRCPTPLRMNEWYAQRQGLTIQALCQDILSIESGCHYDLIATSSFLGYFAPEQRLALFRTLAQLLKPGGKFISSNRLRPASQHAPLERDEERSRAFAEKVVALHAAQARSGPVHDELFERAYDYANRRRPYPLNDTESLEALAQHASLTIERLDIVRSAERKHEFSGPTLQDGSPYAFFIMSKPG